MISIKPIITETTIDLAKKRWYTFGSPTGVDKNRLREIIEEVFKVDVISLRTMVVKGKNKRSSKTRKMIKQPDWKKVLAKVKEGQKIEIFEAGA